MSRKPVALIAAALLTSGCVTHQLIVRNPNPTDEQPAAISSNGFGFGALQRRNVAECDSNLIDEVRVRQNLAQALATLLTLGLWMPTRIEYRCAKVPSTTGTIGDGGDGEETGEVAGEDDSRIEKTVIPRVPPTLSAVGTRCRTASRSCPMPQFYESGLSCRCGGVAGRTVN